MDREDKGSEEESQVTSPDTQELATVEGPEPTPPQDMPDEECEEFRKRAKELVDELTGASGSKRDGADRQCDSCWSQGPA